LKEAQIKAETAMATIQDKVAERISREKIEDKKMQDSQIKLQMEQLIHAHDAARDMAAKDQELQQKSQQHAMDLQHEAASAKIGSWAEAHKQHNQIQMDSQKHQAEMARDAQKHTQTMAHERELQVHRAKEAENKAKVAKIAKPATSKKPKKGK